MALKFFTKVTSDNGITKTMATPLFAALVMVELADLIFAIDSIPAIFAITNRPIHCVYVKYFCNIGFAGFIFCPCGND